MAVAKILCGACGGALTMIDRVCPHCGEEVELLGPGTPPVARPAEKKAGRSSRRPGIQRWQVAAGVIVLALLGLFGYLEFSRPGAPPASQDNRPPAGGGAPVMEQLARLEAAVTANPTDPAALITLANALHDVGMSEPSFLPRAVEVYGRYLSVRPDDPNALVDMGICHFEMARTDTLRGPAHINDAVRAMTSAFRIDSLHQPAAFNLGVVNLYSANTDESARWFRKAIAIAPNSELGKRARSLLDQHAFPSPSP